MEIRSLTNADALWYPSVVAIACGVQFTECDEEGKIRHRYNSIAGSPNDRVKIESAIYDPRHNMINVSCRNDQGNVNVYGVHLEAGSKEMKGRRTLTCKVLSLAMKSQGRKLRGELETMNGHKLTMTRLKHERAVDIEVNCWIHKLALNGGFLTATFDNVEPKLRQKLLDAQKTSYWSADFKLRVMLNEISNAVTGWLQDRVSIKDAIAWGLIPDYPVVELPYSLFHKYDQEEKLEFQGLYIPHSETAHKMNLQTAARISRAMGEPVTVDDLSHAVHGVALPNIVIGGHSAYCLATATKTTKEVK